MTELEMVLYTAGFTTFLTTFATILLKRFDSRQAENDRKINDEIARLNREYEVKTTLRDKYEEVYITFLEFEKLVNEYLLLEPISADNKYHEIITLSNNIGLIIDLYFEKLQIPFGYFLKRQFGFFGECKKLVQKFADPVQPGSKVHRIGNLVDKHNRFILIARVTAAEEFQAKLSEFASKYTFIPPGLNEITQED